MKKQKVAGGSMEVLNVQKNQVIAKKKDKIKEWYLIQEGSVTQKFEFSEVKLGKNAIIGILESDYLLCDYIANEDTVLAVFPCGGAEDLKRILSGQERIRGIFLKAAIEQRHQMLCLYADLYKKTRQFHVFMETMYNEYKNSCAKYSIEEQSFSKMEHLKPLEMRHKAENWEVNNSVSLVRNYMAEYLQLMEKDDSLTVGAIMEAAAQMRRVTQGIGEMESYLLYNKEILLSDSENDIFSLFFELAVAVAEKKADIEPIRKEISVIAEFIQKLRIFDSVVMSHRFAAYQNYDFENMSNGGEGNAAPVKKKIEIDLAKVDTLKHILTFAGYTAEEMEVVRKKIQAYKDLPDMTATDDDAYRTRRQLVPVFYEVYERAFMKAMQDESKVTPILEMFFNFGYMDIDLVGEENASQLLELTEHLNVCNSEHIHTIYEWLKMVYRGQKEPSKNEFDMDFPQYLADQRKTGEITAEQVKTFANDQLKKVEYELHNMFPSVNKTTYGKITTFCPLLNEIDLINSPDKMLVTAEKIENAMNEVRKVDFSVFYREVMFSDPARDLNSEMIMKEVLPDIILMPNAGTKAMMWQETSGVKRDTPGRFMFSIFTAVDLEDMMVETMGRFRWEMCRKIQGVHWNDIREKSLTAEYCDFIQFYRKNHELSTEAKEKMKSALVRAKNNYREVFVKDYINWIKFESKGSFRLNKVARDILIRYCPFVKDVRNDLKANPMYQNSIQRYEVGNNKKIQRIMGVYDKYQKAGGEITQELKENLEFYSM